MLDGCSYLRGRDTGRELVFDLLGDLGIRRLGIPFTGSCETVLVVEPIDERIDGPGSQFGMLLEEVPELSGQSLDGWF